MKNEVEKRGTEEELALIKAFINLGKLDHKCESYNDWRDVGFSIYTTDNTETGLGLFDLFSQRSSNYDEDGVKLQWGKFHNKCENPLTIASLRMWAKGNNKPAESVEVKPAESVEAKPVQKVEVKPVIQLIDKMNIINEPFSIGLLADYFKSKYDTFLFSNNKLYNFNGIYWVEDDKNRSNILKFIDNEFRLHLVDYVNTRISIIKMSMECDDNDKEKNDRFLENAKTFIGNILKLRNITFRKTLVDDIIIKLTDNSVVFNKNPYLFAFDNAVFDFTKNDFIKPNPKDYINTSCGYNYDFHYDKTNITTLQNIIKNILPDEKVRNYYLSILSTGLIGVQMENCFIANGSGGNGKSLLNSFMLSCVGNYGYVLPSSVLLSQIKEGANPQVANLNDKRFVLASEPDANRNICGSTLKEITGAPYLNTRGLYSDVCKIVLSLSLVIECNTLLKVDEINEAITRRVRVIPFKSKFITEDKYNELDETEKLGYYIGNAYYKTEEFKQSIRQALFIILKDCFKSVFIDNQIKLPVEPEVCKKKTIEYLSTSDDIYTWFSEIYEKSDDNNILYFEDIYDTFINSEYYSNLSKLDKRKNNKKNFYSKVEDNIFLKKYIKMRDTYVNKIRIKKDAVVGWKLKTAEENDCEGEEETKVM